MLGFGRRAAFEENERMSESDSDPLQAHRDLMARRRRDRKKHILWAVLAVLVFVAWVVIGNLIPDDDSGPSREERERNETCQNFPEVCVPDDQGEIPVP
jgi:hypothetical protein